MKTLKDLDTYLQHRTRLQRLVRLVFRDGSCTAYGPRKYQPFIESKMLTDPLPRDYTLKPGQVCGQVDADVGGFVADCLDDPMFSTVRVPEQRYSSLQFARLTDWQGSWKEFCEGY